MVPAAILIGGALATTDAALTALASIVVAMIGGIGTVTAVVIQTKRAAQRQDDKALNAVSEVDIALEVVRGELERAHERIDLVEEREARCLETAEEQMNEILRLRSMVVAMGGSADLLDL